MAILHEADVVVFNYPLQPEMNYIKRIVGIPGDVVEYRDKVLTVNGEIIPENQTAIINTQMIPIHL